MTTGSSIRSRFVTNRTCSKESVLSSMSQLVHSKTAKSRLNEPNGVVNRLIQFTEMFPFNRTIPPRIRHRSSAHAQSSSTIAVWLARLVARVWSYCQEIGWILICGQVESFFIYLNQPNCTLSLFLVSVLKDRSLVPELLLRSSRLSRHCLCSFAGLY